MVWSLISRHYRSLFLWEWGAAYSHCACRAVQSHAGNISAQWLTSSSTRFAAVPTRWSNCSHSRNFHTSPEDNFSRQTHFLFHGHHLPQLLAWPCNTRLLPLGLCKNQGIWNTSCQYSWLKQQILKCIQGNPKEFYVLWQPFHRDGRSVLNDMVVTYKCHIQTIMTEINPLGRGTHPTVFIKFFHFALKSYFI